MLTRVYIKRKSFLFKFRLPKLDSISQGRHPIFLALGFAKYLQVFFVHPDTPFFVFVSFAFVFLFGLNLFQQQVHQFFDPLFQRLFL